VTLLQLDAAHVHYLDSVLLHTLLRFGTTFEAIQVLCIVLIPRFERGKMT
jgi:hypothetical protein